MSSQTETRTNVSLVLRFNGMQGTISVRNHHGSAIHADDIVSAFVELDALSREWTGEVPEIVMAASALCSEPQRKNLIDYLMKPTLSPPKQNKHHIRHAMYTIISRRYN